MKSIQEKLKLVHEHNKRMSELTIASVKALNVNDMLQIIMLNEKIKKEQAEMCQMYSNEIMEAINPMSHMTIPIIMTVLQMTLGSLEKQYPNAKPMAKDIRENVGCNVVEINFNGRNIKNEKKD